MHENNLGNSNNTLIVLHLQQKTLSCIWQKTGGGGGGGGGGESNEKKSSDILKEGQSGIQEI